MLDTIYCFIAGCMIQGILIYGYRKISNFQNTYNKKRILIIIPFALIMAVLNYYNLSSVHTICSIFFYYIDYAFIYRQNKNKVLFYGTVLWLMTALVDMITMFTLSITSIIELFSSNLMILRVVDTMAICLIMYAIYNIKSLNQNLSKVYDKIKKIKFPYFKIFLIIAVITSLGLTFFAIMQQKGFSDIKNIFYVLVACVSILAYSYATILYRNYVLSETKEYLIKNNEFYIKMINDYRVLKHNIIHQLNGIKSVSNKKATNLINDLIEHYNENTIHTQYLKNMPTGISGIIYEKIYNYNQTELQLSIDNHIESSVFDNLTPRSYNLLCEALGVLLDNSLEACMKTTKKTLLIDMNETENSYSIKIINTFNETLDLDKLGTAKYTTHKSGHGIGLFSLIGRKKIKIKTSIINDLFLNEITILKTTN